MHKLLNSVTEKDNNLAIHLEIMHVVILVKLNRLYNLLGE